LEDVTVMESFGMETIGPESMFLKVDNIREKEPFDDENIKIDKLEDEDEQWDYKMYWTSYEIFHYIYIYIYYKYIIFIGKKVITMFDDRGVEKL